jgi:TolB-like protein/class 3 adenylate cyclase
VYDPQLAKRLAAVLVADVAGYARLMENDEAATYAAWRSARAEAIEPAVARHGGRIVKFTGDGFLAEFPTAESALASAVDVQKGWTGRDPLKLRIGIHLGDVVLEDDDIYGDGVNIAARLETLAEPGGICISGTVHDLVRRKAGVAFSDGGDAQLRHIDQPVRIWRAGAAQFAVTNSPASAPSDATTRRPGIAVLPFANMSGDLEQEYFADGLTEDLITELSRTGALFVIARNSTFVYKGRAVSIPDIARELRVRYVLEGSVRKAGGRVRVTAQLIDGGSGGHLWAERYDRDLTDIFAVQDEITSSITRALALNLSAHAEDRIAGTGTSNVEAYDLFLKARDLAWRLTRASNREGMALVERAIALDPGFARGYALLGHIHLTTWLNRWAPDAAEHERQALESGQTAVSLNAFDPFGYWVVASVHLWRKQFEVALTMTQRALALDPGFTPVYSTMGGALLGLGRAAEALEAFEVMHRADPHAPPIVMHFRARALFLLDRLDEAAALLEDRIARDPDTDVSRALLASIYGHLGRADDAGMVWAGLFETNPDYSLQLRKNMLSDREYEKLAEGISKAGLVEPRHGSID